MTSRVGVDSGHRSFISRITSSRLDMKAPARAAIDKPDRGGIIWPPKAVVIPVVGSAPIWKATVTRHLYHGDAYCQEIDARIVRALPGNQGRVGYVLDRTCFYPSSGGQPCDHGTLDGAPVVDVTEQDGEVVHWLTGRLPGPEVHGHIDWLRRFDHMQQHTGQHILSQAFLDLLHAQTVSFHLGEETCTIDLDLATLQPGAAEKVEDLANSVVFGDRPIIARFVSAEEVTALGLRKAPSVSSDIRIVGIGDFDLSPCGGTHCARSGEVGTIAIRHRERRGQETRVEFACGWRALRDHRWKTAAINELALSFSVKDREMASAVQRLQLEAAEHHRELLRLREEHLATEAGQLLEKARPWREARVVVQALSDRDTMELRKLASLITAHPGVVALLGAGGAQARLVFARSSDAGGDMAAILKETCRAFGGNGGGQPYQAQGGGFAADSLVAALQLAFHTLTEG